MNTATQRRLDDELNIAAALEPVYHFCYQAKFGDAGSENELCHVFLGTVSGELKPNDSEIESVRFVSATDLAFEFANRPGDFTPWFMQEWCTLNEDYSEHLARYAM